MTQKDQQILWYVTLIVVVLSKRRICKASINTLQYILAPDGLRIDYVWKNCILRYYCAADFIYAWILHLSYKPIEHCTVVYHNAMHLWTLFKFPGFSEAEIVIVWWLNGNYNKYRFCIPIFSPPKKSTITFNTYKKRKKMRENDCIRNTRAAALTSFLSFIAKVIQNKL